MRVERTTSIADRDRVKCWSRRDSCFMPKLGEEAFSVISRLVCVCSQHLFRMALYCPLLWAECEASPTGSLLS